MESRSVIVLMDRTRRPREAFLLVLALLVACGGEEGSAEPEPTNPTNAAPRTGDDPEAAPDEASAEPAEPQGPPKRIFASRFVVPVRAEPSRDAERIGYLRAGAVLMAKTAEPVGNERCRGGWYELTTGGFVCNGRTVIAFEGERLPAVRARQPDRDAHLPYEYGFVRRRVPQYRRLPSDEEAAEFEGYRIPGAEPTASTSESGTMEGSSMGASAMEASAMNASAMSPGGMEAIAAAMNASPIGASAMRPNPADEAPSAPDEAPGGSAEGEEEEDTGPTLASLQGEDDSVVERWLMRGFWLSLDRDFRRRGRRYWRTQANGFVPYGAVMKRTGSEFQGVELTEEVTLPYAWTLSSRDRYYVRRDNGRFGGGRRAEYHHGFPVQEEVEDGRYTYLREAVEADEGEEAEDRWYRDRDVRVARAVEPPSEIGPEDKWIEVNLAEQTLVLYDGRTPVYATLISSGLPNRRNLDRDFETIDGLFRVKSKHLTDTMDGDTAVDGPYSVDDVPYVMYFELAYALHAAFWHNRFGRPKSHGCVNLSPLDARHVFDWADPPLPEGWHSAYPSEEAPGTWIWVHGETIGHTE